MINDTIQKTIEELLYHLGVEYENIEIVENGLGVVFNVKSRDSKLLIGTGGVNLLALNHLVKRIVDKDHSSTNPFMVDVNGYQLQHNKEISDRAQVFADRVKSFSSEVEMEPMSSYERMIVHSALADEKEVTTESAGSGRDRHVVIKPANI